MIGYDYIPSTLFILLNKMKVVNGKNSYRIRKDDHENSQSEEALRKMIKISMVCIGFMIVEIIGGLLAGSIAIISDAAHLFSDMSGFLISIVAIWIGKRGSNSKFTFGYNRAEVIGAMISVITIWILTAVLIQEAIIRIRFPTPIDAITMFVTAVIGLGCNLAMIKILHSGPGHSHGNCGHSHGLPGFEFDEEIHNKSSIDITSNDPVLNLLSDTYDSSK